MIYKPNKFIIKIIDFEHMFCFFYIFFTQTKTISFLRYIINMLL